jgi:hypothetical protein
VRGCTRVFPMSRHRVSHGCVRVYFAIWRSVARLCTCLPLELAPRFTRTCPRLPREWAQEVRCAVGLETVVSSWAVSLENFFDNSRSRVVRGCARVFLKNRRRVSHGCVRVYFANRRSVARRCPCLPHELAPRSTLVLENYVDNDTFLGDAVLVLFGGIEFTRLAAASSSASSRLGRVRRPRRRRGYQLAKGTTHHAEKPHELSGPGSRGARRLGLGDFGPGFPCAVESFEFKEHFGGLCWTPGGTLATSPPRLGLRTKPWVRAAATVDYERLGPTLGGLP